MQWPHAGAHVVVRRCSHPAASWGIQANDGVQVQVQRHTPSCTRVHAVVACTMAHNRMGGAHTHWQLGVAHAAGAQVHLQYAGAHTQWQHASARSGLWAEWCTAPAQQPSARTHPPNVPRKQQCRLTRGRFLGSVFKRQKVVEAGVGSCARP